MSSFKETLARFPGSRGETLSDLSARQPTLVVFLRHAGCPFCRETLSRLKKSRGALLAQGIQPVLAHLSDDESGRKLFAEYGLDDLPRFSDPDRQLYRAFGLERAGIGQVMGPGVWWKGFKTTVLGGHLPGWPQGDVFQLSGTFLLKDSEIVAAHRPETSADAIDFEEFVACPLPQNDEPAETLNDRKRVEFD